MLNKNQIKMLQSLPKYPDMLKLSASKYDEYPSCYGLTRQDLIEMKRAGIIDFGYVGPGPSEATFFLQRGVYAADAEREYKEHRQDQDRSKRAELIAVVSLLVSAAAFLFSVLRT